MMDDRQLLERALRGFEPEPGLAERVIRRRDRKRRNQRVRAGVLGVTIAIAIAVALAARPMFTKEPVTTPTPTPSSAIDRIGFIGLPPEEIGPTGPVAQSDVVVSLDTTVSAGDPYKTTLFVYADGRMIWERHAGPTGVPEGAKPANTGYLQQTLTPEGIEMLKAEVISSGLFEEDLHLRGGYEANGDIYGVRISVQRGDRLVSLSWAGGYDDERNVTRQDLDAIRTLVGRLRDPGAWLPDTAWQDRAIHAYIPAEYRLTFSLVGGPTGECCRHPDPSRLPPPADVILTGELNQCIELADARRLIEAFDAAGIESRDDEGFATGRAYETGAYELEVEPQPGGTQSMFLYPALPDRPCRADG